MQPKPNIIKGILTNCITGKKSTVNIEYEITEHFRDNPEGMLNENDRRSFRLVNGVTGYESFYIDSDFRNVKEICQRGWHACVGTEGSWDDLVIPAEEMMKVDWEKER